MINQKPFAEVIESSLTHWMAQSWQWNQFPSYGSLLMVEQPKRMVLGIVYQMQTGSMDPVRYPFPYQKTEEELLREQPQIFEFLKTTFSCLPLGYQEKGIMHYQLPPKPVKIHAFVQPPSSEVIKQFFSKDQYLHLLFGFSQHIGNLDELLLALLKWLGHHNLLTEAKIEEFITMYHMLSGNEYRHIKLFLQRIQHLIAKSTPHASV